MKKWETGADFWTKLSGYPHPERCWEWPSYRHGAYGSLWYKGKQRRAHRVAYELVNGKIPRGLNVCHTCDNPPCCNPRHLVASSQSFNLLDAYRKGRRAPTALNGELNPRAKLTDTQVQEIRDDPRIGRVIAKDYGITQGYVSRIKRGDFRKTA